MMQSRIVFLTILFLVKLISKILSMMFSRYEELCTNQYIIVSLLVTSTTLQIDLPFILTLIKKQHLNEMSYLPNTVAYVTFPRNKRHARGRPVTYYETGILFDSTLFSNERSNITANQQDDRSSSM